MTVQGGTLGACAKQQAECWESGASGQLNGAQTAHAADRLGKRWSCLSCSALCTPWNRPHQITALPTARLYGSERKGGGTPNEQWRTVWGRDLLSRYQLSWTAMLASHTLSPRYAVGQRDMLAPQSRVVKAYILRATYCKTICTARRCYTAQHPCRVLQCGGACCCALAHTRTRAQYVAMM